MKDKRVGILVAGGPAPGINAVIGAATIEGVNQGYDVFGFYDGLKWLASEEFDQAAHAVKLDIDRVARIHFTGGSILRISRTNLLNEQKLKTTIVVEPDETKLHRVITHLNWLGIQQLITIGGEDTALSARFITDAAEGRIRVVHVPKTIDNDLPLPSGESTFGFSTARYVGTQIVKNLMEDSRTTGRWYLVETMGRNAGWLAMSICQSAGATLALIPEEFAEITNLQRIADVLEGAILKRRAMGRPDGVCIIAEGLAFKLGDKEELERLMGREVSLDAAGHVRLSEVPLGNLLKQELVRRFEARGEKLPLVTHQIGYEMRSADPTPADMAYCRSLGHSAIRLLSEYPGLPPGVMVTIIGGNLLPINLRDLVDPATNRIRVRYVDVNSDIYRIARAYMIRLERADLENPVMLAKLAAAAKTTPEEFRERYTAAATRLANGAGAHST